MEGPGSKPAVTGDLLAEIEARTDEEMLLIQRLMVFHDELSITELPTLAERLAGILDMPTDTCQVCTRQVYFLMDGKCYPCTIYAA